MTFDFLRFFLGGDDNVAPGTADVPLTTINPSTGLPMMDGTMGGVDIGGSPFGMDVHSSLSDSFTDCMGSNPSE